MSTVNPQTPKDTKASDSYDLNYLLALIREKEDEIAQLKEQLHSDTTLEKVHDMVKDLSKSLYEHDKYIKDRGIQGKIKAFLKPRLGVLHQYDSNALLATPPHYLKKKTLKNPPRISIVTPSYNQGRFIERTILSVLDQDYPALEYIIQDGGSNDGTQAVVAQYESQLKHFESQKDTGQSNAINLGFRHASGEIMAYLNSDDMLMPGTLNYVANYFKKHPEVDVVYGHRILINEDNFEVGHWILPKHCDDAIVWADYVPQETLFWRRSIWEKAGGMIDENFQFAMDWDLLLRFRKLNARFVRLPRFLGAFRVHNSQKTHTNMSNTGLKEIRILRQRYHGRPVTNQEVSFKTKWYLIKHILLHKLNRAGFIKF